MDYLGRQLITYLNMLSNNGSHSATKSTNNELYYTGHPIAVLRVYMYTAQNKYASQMQFISIKTMTNTHE